MSKLRKERLDQMIENALSYKQEVKTLKSNNLFKRLKGMIYKPKIYGLTFASFIISYFFMRVINRVLRYINPNNSRFF